MMPSDGKAERDPRVARDARLPRAILCHAVGVMSPPANAGGTDNNKLSVISNQQSAINNRRRPPFSFTLQRGHAAGRKMM